MKTIGRILIILAVFAALSGLMVLAVNSSGGSSAPDFDGASPRFQLEGDEGGIRPEGGHARPEHGERGGAGGAGLMFGLIKNIAVVALLVTLIVLPKSLMRNKRKQAVVNSTSGSA